MTLALGTRCHPFCKAYTGISGIGGLRFLCHRRVVSLRLKLSPRRRFPSGCQSFLFPSVHFSTLSCFFLFYHPHFTLFDKTLHTPSSRPCTGSAGGGGAMMFLPLPVLLVEHLMNHKMDFNKTFKKKIINGCKY